MLHPDSRYMLGNLFRRESDNAIYTELRPRLSFEDRDDVIMYEIQAGDTLFSIAQRAYSQGQSEDAAHFWWAIADFQPEPINDPTIALVPGEYLLIPSLDFIRLKLNGDAIEDLNTV